MNLGAVVFTVLLAGCQKSEQPAAPPPPPPTEGLVTAMKDFCKITTLPEPKQREAMKLWGWQTAGNKDVGPIWTAAATKKNPSAIAMLRAAADVAVGPGNCPQLDILKGKP
jgi:nitrous oxide reductase accessory protein NosL